MNETNTDMTGPSVSSPSVLVIDDDEACLDEYIEIVDSLGYSCRSAKNANDALTILNSDESVGIVVTDFQMPGMDGLGLLEEISARSTSMRPITALMVTGHGSLQTAVEAMRLSAVDFVAKPLQRGDLVSALRRAATRRSQLLGQAHIAALHDAAAGGKVQPDLELEDEEQQLRRFLRGQIASRRRRSEFINSELFTDPAWDILLELTLAKLDKTPIPTTSACAATQVPFSTAFRHVGNLVTSGLVRRWKDEHDSRRVMLELEDDTYEAMTDYLLSIKASSETGSN
ncbi:MAG: response regulator [Altererythrobacter sp.]|uniref:response regulator n=1 Tax=Altererythrobacter sp. TaxID=1872480 RepID=UPI001B1DB5DB|nr:response regulator [Altererythrobacter sp.]MBO6642788.1 response regulator [Altererythrobacter sp.]MBO6708704.1 response regulator [Altererythrobacter sp.]